MLARSTLGNESLNALGGALSSALKPVNAKVGLGLGLVYTLVDALEGDTGGGGELHNVVVATTATRRRDGRLKGKRQSTGSRWNNSTKLILIMGARVGSRGERSDSIIGLSP